MDEPKVTLELTEPEARVIALALGAVTAIVREDTQLAAYLVAHARWVLTIPKRKALVERLLEALKSLKSDANSIKRLEELEETR